ncbi:unnamed protein product [Parnassius apollo]|uniref:(apollo) hypothetical protein n=1 Tax=Parnassius apollo TaxID=110799 RepID=A0A8S3XC07_PARAO|nr:unnamed protein product [Parnassius apollo]
MSGNNRTGVVCIVRRVFAETSISLSQTYITQKLTKSIDDPKQKNRCLREADPTIYPEVKANQNGLLQSDQKRLFKSLERPEVCGAGPEPDQADTIAFWRGLWSEPINYSEGSWIEVVTTQGASVTPMNPITITPEDVAEAVRRAPNWKRPGLDRLNHYWLKGFVECHAVHNRQF